MHTPSLEITTIDWLSQDTRIWNHLENKVTVNTHQKGLSLFPTSKSDTAISNSFAHPGLCFHNFLESNQDLFCSTSLYTPKNAKVPWNFFLITPPNLLLPTQQWIVRAILQFHLSLLNIKKRIQSNLILKLHNNGSQINIQHKNTPHGAQQNPQLQIKKNTLALKRELIQT